jgi:hypothetical protein
MNRGVDGSGPRIMIPMRRDGSGTPDRVRKRSTRTQSRQRRCPDGSDRCSRQPLEGPWRRRLAGQDVFVSRAGRVEAPAQGMRRMPRASTVSGRRIRLDRSMTSTGRRAGPDGTVPRRGSIRQARVGRDVHPRRRRGAEAPLSRSPDEIPPTARITSTARPSRRSC